MAAGILNKAAVCDEPCAHEDCAQSRAQAESKCRECGRPIGFGVCFYTRRDPEMASGWDADEGMPLVHATCLDVVPDLVEGLE